MKKRLEVGDKITVLDSHSKPAGVITVTRVTNTIALCEREGYTGNKYESKFNRDVESEMSFCEKGDTSWQRTWYRLTVNADFVILKIKAIRNRAKKADWDNLPLAKLNRIIEILDEQ